MSRSEHFAYGIHSARNHGGEGESRTVSLGLPPKPRLGHQNAAAIAGGEEMGPWHSLGSIINKGNAAQRKRREIKYPLSRVTKPFIPPSGET